MSNSIPPPTGAVYRTPSLAFVDRWINVSGVLEGSVGVHAASAALAFIFQNEDIQCSPGSSGSVFVAYVDEGSRELAQGVAASLAGQFLQFPLPGGLESYSQTHSLTLNPDSRVVIVADIIHSANTAKRAIEEIRALGGIPLATLTVIDARPLQTDRILDVPVLSLCEQQVSVPQPEDSSRVINIDALLHSPTRDEQARSAILSYPISEAELLERCKEERAEGSLCFSHMQSELGRHFFAFPDALRLFDDDFINKACLTAETWLNMAVTKTNGPIEFWIPGLLSDDASELAPSIIAGVKELIPSATFLRPVSIERSASLGRWVFATGLSQGTQGAHVVMLDWGSLTSSTILQFLHENHEGCPAL